MRVTCDGSEIAAFSVELMRMCDVITLKCKGLDEYRNGKFNYIYCH